MSTANKYFKGEKIAVAGELKNSGTVTTAYTMVCQVMSPSMHLLKEVALTVDSETSKYVGTITTDDLLGQVKLRYIAKTSAGDIVVGNEETQITIYK